MEEKLDKELEGLAKTIDEAVEEYFKKSNQFNVKTDGTIKSKYISNLDNLRIDKKKLEEEINNKVNEFQNKYKVTITDIKLETNNFMTINNGTIKCDTKVSIRVEI